MQKRPQAFRWVFFVGVTTSHIQTSVDAEVQINRASLHYHSKHFALKIQKEYPQIVAFLAPPRVLGGKISSNQTKANMKFRKNRPQDAHGFP